MLKNITIFLSGTALGAAVIFGIIFGFKPQFIYPQTQIPPPSQIAQMPETAPSPTPEETAPPPPSPLDQRNTQEALEKLKKQLYEEGINISATVDRVFPGAGFIAKDEQGVKLFVYWPQTPPPTQGATISLQGTLGRVAEGKEMLQKEPGFTADLDQFLRDQTIFIRAQEVQLS